MKTERTVTVNTRNIGLFGFLGLMFIGLKLTGFINWSWWLVLLPFYGGIALVLGIVIVLLVIGFIAVTYDEYKSSKQRK